MGRSRARLDARGDGALLDGCLDRLRRRHGAAEDEFIGAPVDGARVVFATDGSRFFFTTAEPGQLPVGAAERRSQSSPNWCRPATGAALSSRGD
jgi:hypothetical protein